MSVDNRYHTVLPSITDPGMLPSNNDYHEKFVLHDNDEKPSASNMARATSEDTINHVKIIPVSNNVQARRTIRGNTGDRNVNGDRNSDHSVADTLVGNNNNGNHDNNNNDGNIITRDRDRNRNQERDLEAQSSEENPSKVAKVKKYLTTVWTENRMVVLVLAVIVILLVILLVWYVFKDTFNPSDDKKVDPNKVNPNNRENWQAPKGRSVTPEMQAAYGRGGYNPNELDARNNPNYHGMQSQHHHVQSGQGQWQGQDPMQGRGQDRRTSGMIAASAGASIGSQQKKPTSVAKSTANNEEELRQYIKDNIKDELANEAPASTKSVDQNRSAKTAKVEKIVEITNSNEDQDQDQEADEDDIFTSGFGDGDNDGDDQPDGNDDGDTDSGNKSNGLCNHVFKSGKKKGQMCGAKCSADSTKCSQH